MNYRTFVAVSLTPEEAARFLLNLSALECTSWTRTCITWGEISPRLCTVAIHAHAARAFLLMASFGSGMLRLQGWDKLFVLMPEETPAEEIGKRFNEPNSPDPATLAAVRARSEKSA